MRDQMRAWGTRLLQLGGVLLVSGILPTRSALPARTRAYSSALGRGPTAIVRDGALWFIARSGDLGRITPRGAIRVVPLSRDGSVVADESLTRGPDGALWFTGAEATDNGTTVYPIIGRVTVRGAVRLFPLTDQTTPFFQPESLAFGPDGSLWFGERYGRRIGRLTPSGRLSAVSLPTPDGEPRGLVAGPGDALWYSDPGSNSIGRLSAAGRIRTFPLPRPDRGPIGIAAGPDGALWFTERSDAGAHAFIGRLTPTGRLREFPVPTPDSNPYSITRGPDGALWFTEQAADRIGRITPRGRIREFATPSTGSGCLDITSGPDGALWFTEFNANKIGRLTPTGHVTEFPLP